MRIGFTGYKRSGKDSCARALNEKYGFLTIGLPEPLVEEVAIIDPWCRIDDPGWIAELGTQFARFADLLQWVGYDTAKDISADFRSYLQRYGTDVVRKRIDEDRWCKIAERRMTDIQAGYGGDLDFVLPNIRAFNELALCDVLIGVTRPGHGPEEGQHEIETGIAEVFKQSCFLIVNDGTLADLDTQVGRLLPYCRVHVEKGHIGCGAKP